MSDEILQRLFSLCFLFNQSWSFYWKETQITVNSQYVFANGIGSKENVTKRCLTA